MIPSYRDKRTATFARGDRVAAFFPIERAAQRKLEQLDAATSLHDLARPGNRLEALLGDRKGQWSIRINDQWRLCFVWEAGASGPSDVEIVDYH
jgi:toxin HigB-1